MSAPLIDGVLYEPFQRPLKLRFLEATKRMPVFLGDAHSILRQPALIYADGIAIPSFLNSEHSMVLYPRLYIASRFFPIAGAPGAIPWPTERSVEVTKDR
ncbi:hypothetical protein C9410_23045 [Rhizobium sp. SEMIA 439]|nr:hypothetical protein C9410_23045 [Rhizobium sp. SEMIA 439]